MNQPITKDRSARALQTIEDAWSPFIMSMASMLELGPGPASTISPQEHQDLLKQITIDYERLYTLTKAGLPDSVRALS